MKKFEQMKRLYNSMSSYIGILDCSDTYVAAITSDFDRLFELSWKTLKEYMFTELGVKKAQTGSPRDILALACQERLLSESKLWSAMLRDRNDDAHIYNILAAYEYKNRIEKVYLKAVKSLIDDLAEVIPEEKEQVPLKPPVDLVLYILSLNLDMEDTIAEYCERFKITIEELYNGWDSEYGEVIKKNSKKF